MLCAIASLYNHFENTKINAGAYPPHYIAFLLPLPHSNHKFKLTEIPSGHLVPILRSIWVMVYFWTE